MQAGPIERYGALAGSGAIAADPRQETAARALDGLFRDLTAPPAPRGFFLLRKNRAAPRGVYLYGDVGRGKSMMMDMFYGCLPDGFPKRRVHFHAFMIGVHDRLNRARLEGRADRALADHARAVAAEAKVLCFDEFHVTDVADAMILSRLFTALFDAGVAVVATSNWPPDRLYEGGLQRDRFLPFIDLVKQRMDVVAMTGGRDYRTQAMAAAGVYFAPLGEAARRKADDLFARLSGGAEPHEDTLEVKGRHFAVQAAGGIARAGFAQLCERPLGAEDYLALAARYHTLFLDGVPRLTYDRRNEAKRLMTLIDVLYENRTRLVVTADAAPDHLYRGHDHAFEFERTVSRMTEMQGTAYIERTGAQ